ncbi:MAG TPA: hypothetical protein VJQ82_06765 [Terriglobales bacterium]|nr:hypothetical protein [Terriglobales bacterium]
MNREESDRLRELCMLAQNEMDPAKLVQLIRQINQIFETSEAREKAEAKHTSEEEGGAPKQNG